MGLNISEDLVDKYNINFGDIINLTISIKPSSDIPNSPVDIVLVLDKSGSMLGEPLEAMKTSIMSFIDTIYEGTDGIISDSSRIGIVSFSDNVVKESELVTNVSQLY